MEEEKIKRVVRDGYAKVAKGERLNFIPVSQCWAATLIWRTTSAGL